MENKAKELYLTVINNGDTYEARCHAAAMLAQGYYDSEGFRKEAAKQARREKQRQ